MPETPVTLDADGTRISQVLSNLLNNAAKFTPAGGIIKLSAAIDASAPTVITFCVTDNGHGIEPNDLARVFEMFTQLGSPGSGGLGIGLSLVKGLVELHGGQVQAKSDGAGKGSTFIVRLPCVLPAAVGAEGGADAHGAAEVLSANARRVLIIDDNEDAATSLSELLALLGHSARAAHDGRSGLAVAAEFLPDVVLLDLGMPGMTGFEVAAALRADPRLAGATLVALTGWGQEDDRRRTRAAGFDHHLVKPPDAVTLERLLRTEKRS